MTNAQPRGIRRNLRRLSCADPSSWQVSQTTHRVSPELTSQLCLSPLHSQKLARLDGLYVAPTAPTGAHAEPLRLR
jgi:hypothetical protein